MAPRFVGERICFSKPNAVISANQCVPESGGGVCPRVTLFGKALSVALRANLVLETGDEAHLRVDRCTPIRRLQSAGAIELGT
jgi:hypothetical protein